jgi:hypothetical protein
MIGQPAETPIMTKKFQINGLCVAAAMALVSTNASAADVTLAKLTGTTGGNPAQTAVYGADLSSFGDEITAISIRDNSSKLGGSPGAFSGFDLDGIKLSTTVCASASCVKGLAGLPVFDFTAAGTTFLPGSQRAPAAARLYGTTGSNVLSNSLATLGLFDGNSDINNPFGFLSMGDNGKITFTLNQAVSLQGLWLYIGEVGDNGEVAASDITIFTGGTGGGGGGVPEPSTWLMMIGGIGFAGAAMRRRQRVSVTYA